MSGPARPFPPRGRPATPGRGAARLLADAQPRYAGIATSLADDILEGRRPVGTMLPTEQELCRVHGCSRSTGREALRRLRELGLVAGAQGVGTRVVADRPRGNYVLAVRSATEVMGYAGPTRLDVRHRARVRADAVLAERIGCDPGTGWCHVAGLRLAAGSKGSPVSLVELFIAEEFAAVAEMPEIVSTPAYRLIGRRMGVAVAEVRQEIVAVALDAAQAASLEAETGSPGLRIRRRFYAADGRLLEATLNVHGAADRFSYSLRLGAPED